MVGLVSRWQSPLHKQDRQVAMPLPCSNTASPLLASLSALVLPLLWKLGQLLLAAPFCLGQSSLSWQQPLRSLLHLNYISLPQVLGTHLPKSH